jgi:hypothetical protein
MTVRNRHERVNKFLEHRTMRVLDVLNESVRDPRSTRGRKKEDRRALEPILHVLFAGMLACDKTLRDVEERSEELALMDGDEPVGRIPDTTMGDLLAKLDPDDFEQPLVRQVRDMNRRNELKPVGLPCGVAVVDGKAMGKLTHDAEGHAMRQTDDDGNAFWYVRVLRAVLSSSAGKPCIGQKTIPGREGEITNFPDFAIWLHETYGRHGLFEIFDVDAGFFSRAVFEFIDQDLGYGLVVGLKENQPELLDAARSKLGRIREIDEPEVITDWERYQGKLMRRKLYRTAELDGWLDWKNLRQVWLVVQETATPPKGVQARHHRVPTKDWSVESEDRYFATNLLWNRLKAPQILLVVRNHWSVENDCFHSLDVQWGEDRPAWCGRGRAVIVLGWLRLLAYNLTQGLRRRHLRRRHPKLKTTSPWPWRSLFKLIAAVLPKLVMQWSSSPLSLPSPSS